MRGRGKGLGGGSHLMHLSLLDEHLLLGRYGALALLRVGRRFLCMSCARGLGLHSLDLSLSHFYVIERNKMDYRWACRARSANAGEREKAPDRRHRDEGVTRDGRLHIPS